jgi:hypothetical protein
MSVALMFALSAVGVNVYNVVAPLPLTVQDPPVVVVLVTCTLLCWLNAAETKKKRSKKAYPNLRTSGEACIKTRLNKNRNIEKYRINSIGMRFNSAK